MQRAILVIYFWRDVLSNDTVIEGSRQCLDEGARMFSAFVTPLVGKHWNHSHKGAMVVSKWLMGRISPNGRSYSDFKIWIWVFIFTWDCKQHFPPGTKSSNSQLLQILICESEECLKINLWVKKYYITNVISIYFLPYCRFNSLLLLLSILLCLFPKENGNVTMYVTGVN